MNTFPYEYLWFGLWTIFCIAFGFWLCYRRRAYGGKFPDMLGEVKKWINHLRKERGEPPLDDTPEYIRKDGKT